jgi:uncharacterized protein YcbK (DUF882 family)
MRDCSVHVNSARLNTRGLSAARTGYSVGLAVLIFISGSRALQNAIAEGDTRTISMHHLHTGEDITITYKRNGRYDDGALEKLNWFLRDWRRGEQTRMDPHLIDLAWDVQREANAKEPIQVVCGYRAPQTNAMLRRRSGGVARFSQHMLGHALDFYIPGIPLEQLREIGLRMQRGGVGFYPTSGSPFVHMDTGGVRMWPRMTHEELARVFPDGRTVHIPSDGKPLPGYAAAIADIAKRGGMPSELSIDAARSAGINVDTLLASNEGPAANPFAKLLGLARDDEEDEDAAPGTGIAAPPAPPARAQSRPSASASVVASPVGVDNKPTLSSIAAAVEKSAADPARPKPIRVGAVLPSAQQGATSSANEIIRIRGYWQGPPDGMAVAAPLAARTIRRDVAPKSGSNGEPAGAIGPFNDPHGDGASPEITLAYAEQPPAHAPAPTSPSAIASAPRPAAIFGEPEIRAERAIPSDRPSPAAQPVLSGTTIAIKRAANQLSSKLLSASASSVIAIKTGVRTQSPWLRAVLVAPSVHRFLTTLALGARDFRSLASLMVKPRSSVMMTFRADPNPGLDHEHFSGPAVVFVSTVSYSSRAAILQ